MNTQERYRFYATIYLELKKKTEDVVADERVELDSLGNILKLSSLSKELGSLQERRNSLLYPDQPKEYRSHADLLQYIFSDHGVTTSLQDLLMEFLDDFSKGTHPEALLIPEGYLDIFRSWWEFNYPTIRRKPINRYQARLINKTIGYCSPLAKDVVRSLYGIGQNKLTRQQVCIRYHINDHQVAERVQEVVRLFYDYHEQFVWYNDPERKSSQKNLSE